MSVYQMDNNQLLTLCARSIENSRSVPEIMEAVAVYGYDEDAFAEGDALLAVFREVVQEKQDYHGQKEVTTEALYDAWDALHEKTYMPHVTIARIAFRDENTRERLGISGDRPDGLDDWIQEAQKFYSILLEDEALAAKMAARGITRAKLEAALQDLAELEALDRTQEYMKSEAQKVTRRRNLHRRAVADWLASYQKIARIALADQPNMIEQFGLSAPSA